MVVGPAAGKLQGSHWLALSLSPFIKQGQTSRIIYQMGQLVSLNTWYEAIRHLITWSFGCSWLGALQPECTCDGLEPGKQALQCCTPVIGFAALHWTMEQVETEREWKNYHVLQGLESTHLPLHLNTNQRTTLSQTNLRPFMMYFCIYIYLHFPTQVCSVICLYWDMI